MVEKNDSSFSQIKAISSKYLRDFDIRIEEIEDEDLAQDILDHLTETLSAR